MPRSLRVPIQTFSALLDPAGGTGDGDAPPPSAHISTQDGDHGGNDFLSGQDVVHTGGGPPAAHGRLVPEILELAVLRIRVVLEALAVISI